MLLILEINHDENSMPAVSLKHTSILLYITMSLSNAYSYFWGASQTFPEQCHEKSELPVSCFCSPATEWKTLLPPPLSQPNIGKCTCQPSEWPTRGAILKDRQSVRHRVTLDLPEELPYNLHIDQTVTPVLLPKKKNFEWLCQFLIIWPRSQPWYPTRPSCTYPGLRKRPSAHGQKHNMIMTPRFKTQGSWTQFKPSLFSAHFSLTKS